MIQDPNGGASFAIMIDATDIKSASKRRKCVLFDIEPHMHVDLKSATVEDIVSANMSLFESMLYMGLLVGNYSKHIRFLNDKGKVFTSASLVLYD